MRRNLPLVLISVLIAAIAYGVFACGPTFDFYVDSVNGLDTNDGLTPQTARQTLTGVNPLLTSSHNRLGVARGSHFRELWQPASGVGAIVGSYGSGGKPIFDGATIISGSWTKTAGLTSVYQIDQPFAATGTVPPTWNVWIFENGTILAPETSTALCDATEGSSFVDATVTAPATVTIYIHATGGSNPGSNGNLYEFTDKPRIIFPADNPTGSMSVENIVIRGSSLKDGGLSVASLYANGVDFQGMWQHACEYQWGQLRNCTTDHGSLDAYGPPAGKNILLENITNTTPSYLAVLGNGTFFEHGGTLDSITLRNITSPTIIGAGDTKYMLVDSCSDTGSLAGESFNPVVPATFVMQNTTINRTSNPPGAGGLLGFTGAVSAIVTNCILESTSTAQANLSMLSLDTSMVSLTMTGTMLATSSGAWNNNLSFAPGCVAVVHLSGNTYPHAGSSGYTYAFYGSVPAGFTSDNNTFRGAPPVFLVGAVENTLAQWQALSYDTHSVYTP